MKPDFTIINPNHAKKLVQGNGPIIIVDDDPDQHTIVRKCYKRSVKSNELVFFKDGEECLDFLESIIKEKKPVPEMVLLDINMPGANGFEILTKIKSHPEFGSIPVVVMFTTSNADRDQKKAEELGANAFWSKPTDINDYINFFNNV